MTINDFELELKAIDSRLSIVPNSNRPQIANIKIDGVDICPIPNHEIREESDPTYVTPGPNGSMMRHRSRQEALAIVNNTLEMIKDPENFKVFFGK